eukprot:CAMPEP_0198227826 /NCGR_PEP_ID=MMETSP1445-20131203/110769_1 /TAXON_ID=36898 /ORGANISM="Pyramimonas sp., Strain CCMP2087" /LENGTH=92 /DNA_ID=CAMNT_0043908005 /DNA_START=321 /DNA_END=595 /DNA_ORIENTATION=+
MAIIVEAAVAAPVASGPVEHVVVEEQRLLASHVRHHEDERQVLARRPLRADKLQHRRRCPFEEKLQILRRHEIGDAVRALDPPRAHIRHGLT